MKRTKSPVMKPEFEAEVKASPAVWVRESTSRMAPRMSPSRRCAPSRGRRRTQGSRQTAERTKRQPTSEAGATVPMTSLTSTKVVPQTNAQ